MGIKFSSTNSADILYINIKDSVRRMILDYEFWTDEKLCNKLEVVYYDKLLQFRKNDLVDVASAIGYKHQDKINKEQVCKQIVEHFKKRIQLLSDICLALDRAKDRVDRAKHGPVCRKVNITVDNFIKCHSIPNSLWLTEKEYTMMVTNLKKLDKYKDWEKWVNQLEDKYFDYLKKLFTIVNKIKEDIDNTMNQTEFEKLALYAKVLITKLDKITEIYHLIIINV